MTKPSLFAKKFSTLETKIQLWCEKYATGEVSMEEADLAIKALRIQAYTQDALRVVTASLRTFGGFKTKKEFYLDKLALARETN